MINIEPETIAELAEIPNVAAVKQANDDLAQAQHIVELGLDLYAGDDNLVQPFLELGGVGGVCVHTHVVGPQGEGAGALAARRRPRGARARSTASSAPAYDLLKVVTNPIAIKCALNLLGHEVGGLRLPLVEATEDERERRPRLPGAPAAPRAGAASRGGPPTLRRWTRSGSSRSAGSARSART